MNEIGLEIWRYTQQRQHYMHTDSHLKPPFELKVRLGLKPDTSFENSTQVF